MADRLRRRRYVDVRREHRRRHRLRWLVPVLSPRVDDREHSVGPGAGGSVAQGLADRARAGIGDDKNLLAGLDGKAALDDRGYGWREIGHRRIICGAPTPLLGAPTPAPRAARLAPRAGVAQSVRAAES